MKYMIPRHKHRDPKGLWKPTNRVFLIVLIYRYWLDTTDS